MKIAVIPARIGSKRIKKKNIKILNGKPLIYYSIEAAKRTRIFDKIYVSTDSEEIKKISKRFGAEVPFKRPNKLSDDYTSTKDVIKHTINWCEANKIYPKYVCCIYPAAPFINYKNIIKSYQLLKKNNYNFIFSATKFQSSVLRSFYLEKKKTKKNISKI